MSNIQTELHKEVVDALVSSKAINFEAVGSILAKFGARAATTGDTIGVIIGHHVTDICIPPFYRGQTPVAIDRVASK